MQSVIELESELLVDRSEVRNPELRLLLDVLARPLISNSAWMVMPKRLAAMAVLPAPLAIPVSSTPSLAAAYRRSFSC